MSRRPNPRADLLRQAVAEEAARIMREQGVDDFLLAKRKAAERLGVNDASILPRNTEIEAALVAHQRLFAADRHEADLAAMRRSALEAMRLMSDFQPRLVGPVLTGTASAHSEINLHLFTESPEAVSIRLEERGVPHEVLERRLRYERDRIVTYWCFRSTGSGRRPRARWTANRCGARALRRSRRCCSQRAADTGSPTQRGKGFGSGFMPGTAMNTSLWASAAASMPRTIPGMNPEPKPCKPRGSVPGFAALTLQPTAGRDSALASRTRRDAGDAVDSGSVGGIVRDMDVAHEAYRDVLAAVPPTDPGAAAAPSGVLLA